MDQEPLQKLIYVGDPMCSWCWGFAPEIEALADEYETEIVVGGLRPGPAAQELEDRMASFLADHWVEIAERTGQSFDTSFLDRRDGWAYDTEPAARAVVTMREMKGDETLEYFTAVQQAFYAEGRDITDFDELVDIAADFGVQGFQERLESEESKQAAWADFSKARNWGITGFPTLVAALPDDRLALLARGWTKADVIRKRISSLGEAATG